MGQGGGRQGDLVVILTKMDDLYSQRDACGVSVLRAGSAKVQSCAVNRSEVCSSGSWVREAGSLFGVRLHSVLHFKGHSTPGQSKSLAFKRHT